MSPTSSVHDNADGVEGGDGQQISNNCKYNRKDIYAHWQQNRPYLKIRPRIKYESIRPREVCRDNLDGFWNYDWSPEGRLAAMRRLRERIDNLKSSSEKKLEVRDKANLNCRRKSRRLVDPMRFSAKMEEIHVASVSSSPGWCSIRIRNPSPETGRISMSRAQNAKKRKSGNTFFQLYFLGLVMHHSSPRTVRLVAYNIFGFRRGSPSQLAAYLKSLMPIDILCLNEVSIKDRKLDQLARNLGEEYRSFFFSTTANKNPDFGNAVITRLPVKSASRIALNGGSSVLWRGDDIQIIRNGVLVDFDKFSVCCTHLDHMKEAERVKQVDGLIEQLRERLCPETPHFIMGDFNELSRRDYSDDEWQNLETRHKNFGWPLECDEVVEKLENGGYTDVLRKCGDLRKTAHTQEAKPLYRIDYAWASRAAIDRVKDGFVHCGDNVDDLKSCSDHFAIVVDACL